MIIPSPEYHIEIHGNKNALLFMNQIINDSLTTHNMDNLLMLYPTSPV